MRTKHFVAIEYSAAFSTTELPSAGAELANICQFISGLAIFKRIEGEELHISKVTGELSKSEWVHFPCHGIPNRKQPFESEFSVRDGGFTIQHTTQCDLEDPGFLHISLLVTRLSGTKRCREEAISLASAMRYAGFRSVIGTKWALDDKVTSVFYRHAVDESIIYVQRLH